jgi:pimeloyl-ACP methyl ester carboxylesterase
MESAAAPESIRHVTSADGSAIGFEVVGSGPPLLLVHTIAIDRTQFAPLRDLFARHFTVYLVDRRGYGLSAEGADGDYSLEREAEDIAAVAQTIGEPLFVWGHSFGGICVLEAAMRGVPFESILADDLAAGGAIPPFPPDLMTGMAKALDAGDRDGALGQFFRSVVGLSDEHIDSLRGTPLWDTRAGTIHLVAREAHVANGYRYDRGRLVKIGCPIRFIVGQESPQMMRDATHAAHDATPDSELTVVAGRLFTTMYADPESAARQVENWLLGGRS